MDYVFVFFVGMVLGGLIVWVYLNHSHGSPSKPPTEKPSFRYTIGPSIPK